MIFSLKKIYGLGSFQTNKICKKLGFSANFKTSMLTNEQTTKLIKLIENLDLKITSDLKKLHVFNLKQLIDIKCYRGLRKIKGLPVRGQRTHTNARTVRMHKRS